MNKRIIGLGFVIMIFLTACSNSGVPLKKCPDGIIEWVDILMINDIKYTAMIDGAKVDDAVKGEKIGEVSYMLSDNACSDHVLSNGDAAYLPEGTEIFKHAQYDSNFRVIAKNKIYQVQENKSVKTIGDLYDIAGKITKLSLESSYDGKHLLDFDAEETEIFVEEFLTLEYVGFDAIYEKIKHSNSSPIRIHLNDGTSFRISYWVEENALNPGAYGTDKMKDIMENVINRKNELMN